MKKTICFDLDGTLCQSLESDYSNATPIRERIEVVNALKAAGVEVVLFTARGASSGRDWASFTRDQLLEWGVEFDRLIFGKPHADLYIDDKGQTADSFFASHGTN